MSSCARICDERKPVVQYLDDFVSYSGIDGPRNARLSRKAAARLASAIQAYKVQLSAAHKVGGDMH